MTAKKNVKNLENFKEETHVPIKEPKHIKMSKLLVLLIPLIIIGYLIFSNFVVAQEFEYFYDIGGNEENYLTPNTRVSEIVIQDPDYRNINNNLVYFDVPIARGSESIKIQVRFKDNFPKDWTMSLGAKDEQVWHYTYNSIFNPAFENLDEFDKIGNVYLINPDLLLISYEELKYEEGIAIATNDQYTPLTNIISGYKDKLTVIDTTLRGKHVFYIYARGDLRVEVKKQDINWYEGSDELEIGLYDLNNILIANATIEDDGIIEVDKSIPEIQNGILQVKDLDEGIYRLEFSDFDGLIREIKINTNKIVSQRLFLADNELYNVETKQSKLYFESSRSGQIRLMTYHSAGIQDIVFRENEIFEFYQQDEPLYMDVSSGEYELTFPENDIIVSGPGYFAFSEENYFEPFAQKVVKLQNDIEWIKNNVDYLVTGYVEPTEDNGWLISQTEFDLRDSNLFVKDNKLSFVFNIPHLSQEAYQDHTIPIDWIKITVYKPGVFEK